MRRLARALVLVCALAAPAAGASYTVPKDTGGIPAAQCSYLGSTGVATLCSATNPLPTANAGGVSPPTSPTTDPVGWGQTWYQGTASPSALATNGMPLALANNAFVAFTKAASGITVDLWSSTNQGATWSVKETVSFGSAASSMYAAVQTSTGAYLVGFACGVATPTCYGLGRLDAGGVATAPTLTGVPNGLGPGGVTAIHQQGGTILAAYTVAADATAYFCKSTDDGVTWVCGATSYAAIAVGKTFDSPAPLVWIRGVVDGVQRSVNDGSTWTSVLTGTTSGTVVECLSSTVCLATDGATKIYRSVNAGLTWQLQYTDPGSNPLYSGFVDWGGGIVAALPGAV